MILPNAERAYIDNAKLKNYCLNPEHPVGKYKAVVFKSVMGITRANYQLLKNFIFAGIQVNSAKENFSDKFGKRYTVVIKLDKFNTDSILVTSWIIKIKENFPRLTSCYIKKQ